MNLKSAVSLIGAVSLIILIGGIRYPLILASALIIHESGHILSAVALGIKLESVKISICGVRLSYNYSNVPPIYEIAVCLAGPLWGIVFSVSAAMLGAAKFDGGLYFIMSSAVLSVINLLPVSGLDGGTILVCMLESFMLPDMAWNIAKKISVLFTLAFWALTVWVQLKIGVNLSMLLLSVYFLINSA